MIHIGCWVHARRKFIDALPSDRSAMEIINMIAEHFKLELAFKVQKVTFEDSYCNILHVLD